MSPPTAVELADDLRTIITQEFLAWSFLPTLGKIVRYGEVRLVFRDEKLNDVYAPIGTLRSATSTGPPKK